MLWVPWISIRMRGGWAVDGSGSAIGWAGRGDRHVPDWQHRRDVRSRRSPRRLDPWPRGRVGPIRIGPAAARIPLSRPWPSFWAVHAGSPPARPFPPVRTIGTTPRRTFGTDLVRIRTMTFHADHPATADPAARPRLNLLFSSSWREGVPSAEPEAAGPHGRPMPKPGAVARRPPRQPGAVHIALVDLEMPMEPRDGGPPATVLSSSGGSSRPLRSSS